MSGIQVYKTGVYMNGVCYFDEKSVKILDCAKATAKAMGLGDEDDSPATDIKPEEIEAFRLQFEKEAAKMGLVLSDCADFGSNT